jgi:hypothetical protein
MSKPKAPKSKKATYRAEASVWRNAIHRCSSSKNAQYNDYGGRGITVDPLFLGPQGFDAFLEAVGPKPSPELTLDRVDNAKGYEPGNLAWTSRTVQQRNRRKTRDKVTDLGWGVGTYRFVRSDGRPQTKQSPLVPLNGKTQTLKEWADELGVHQRTLKQRFLRGATPEQALVSTLFNPWGNPRGQGPAGLRDAAKNNPTIH